MRIGIDGYNLALPRGTGIATYGRVLADTLRGGGHRVEGLFGLDVGQDPALREVMFFDRLAREEPAAAPGRRRRFSWRLFRSAAPPRLHFEAAEVPLTGAVDGRAFAGRLPRFDRLATVPHLFDTAWRHFRLHGRFARVRMADPPEIMHWTYPVPVVLEGARNLYTLHDLVPLRLPHTTLDGKPDYLRLVRACAEHADHLVTVSEASRRDIVELLGVAPGRVTNTWQAAPPPNADIESVRPEPVEGLSFLSTGEGKGSASTGSARTEMASVGALFGLEPQGYFLFVGAVEPKKNVGRLIEAHLASGVAAPLVIAGASAWRHEAELELLATAPPGRVIRIDWLPRSALMRLMTEARALCFPSLAEGFGLPVLEAMQLGVPVLTSDAGALPEVAGAAALLVDPYDVGAIAAALRRLDGDAALRARLAAAGPAEAERFSAARYLVRLEDMYRALAS